MRSICVPVGVEEKREAVLPIRISFWRAVGEGSPLLIWRWMALPS